LTGWAGIEIPAEMQFDSPRIGSTSTSRPNVSPPSWETSR